MCCKADSMKPMQRIWSKRSKNCARTAPGTSFQWAATKSIALAVNRLCLQISFKALQKFVLSNQILLAVDRCQQADSHFNFFKAALMVCRSRLFKRSGSVDCDQTAFCQRLKRICRASNATLSVGKLDTSGSFGRPFQIFCR